MTKLFPILLTIAFFWKTDCYCQKFSKLECDFSEKNLFLFGEMHFVNEKYEEIKKLSNQIIDNKVGVDSVTLFLELPHSFQYIANKFLLENDTSAFELYFNNLYARRFEKPSLYWTKFKDLFYYLSSYVKRKHKTIIIKSVDVEKKFRRTAYVLSEIYETNNIKGFCKNQIDSLLHSKIVTDSPKTRMLLLKNINKVLSTFDFYKEDRNLLNTMRQGLEIECFSCGERDQFMFDNFITTYSFSNTHLSIGIFGMSHIMNEFAFKKEKSETTFRYITDSKSVYKPFFMLFPEKIKEKSYTIGIVALNQSSKNYNILKPKPVSIPKLNKRGYKFLKKMVSENACIRIKTSEFKKLKSFSTYIDYLIVYETSYFE